MSARYAIYYVPDAASALYRFGAAVLGYDAYTGQDTPYIDGVDAAQWPKLTREPRVYGFHATMKPPMRLKDEFAESDLLAAFVAFARTQSPFDAGRLVARELGSFIALVPAERSAPLHALADSCVRYFDDFRAPMGEHERAKRLKPGLSDRQIDSVHRWGYPHVFDDFRFHMTLTGSLPENTRKVAFRFLCEKFEQLPAAAPLRIDRLAICKQAAPGARFIVLQVAALSGSD